MLSRSDLLDLADRLYRARRWWRGSWPRFWLFGQQIDCMAEGSGAKRHRELPGGVDLLHLRGVAARLRGVIDGRLRHRRGQAAAFQPDRREAHADANGVASGDLLAGKPGVHP